MNAIQYRTITTIKENLKTSVFFALIDGYEDPVIVKRLKNANPEVYRMLSEMDSIHIPHIYAWEWQGEELVVAEEYVDGETLQYHLEQGKLTEEQKLSIALQLCEAVEVLHGCTPPIIHRDIKPSNILLTQEGIVKLIDFDVSRRYKKMSDTSDTRVLGTAEYAAPEQFGYMQTDVRSDIYSMGVVFRGLEVRGNGMAALLWKHILNTCTGFDPEKRYKNVKILAKDIRRVMTLQKLRWLPYVGILCIGILLGAGGLLLSKSAEEEDKPAVGSDLTVTPEATQGVTLTPTNMLTPASTPTNIPMPTLAEEFALIELILKEQTVLPVDNYYQGENKGKAYLVYSSLFESASGVISATLTEYASGRVLTLSEGEYRLEDAIFCLDEKYVQSLQNSYYRLNLELSTKEGNISYKTHLRIYSPEEVFIEGDYALQGNYLDYCYKEHEKLHTVLRADANTKIVGLYVGMVKKVPEEQYRILHDGRAIELSKELLEQCKSQVETIFYVELDDGSREMLTIANPYMR